MISEVHSPTATLPTTPGTGTPTHARPGAKSIAPEYERQTMRMGRDVHRSSDVAGFIAMHRSEGPGWLSSDGTTSMRMPDGRILWSYGDTVIGRARDGKVSSYGGFLRNSLVVQDGELRTTLVKRDADGRPSASIPSPRPNEWYWLGQPFVDGDEIKMVGGRVRRTNGPHGWNFTGAGTDIIRLDARTLAYKGVAALSRDPGTTWGENVFRYGDYTYFTGGRDDAEWAPAMLLGRAKVGEFEPGKLEFWNGSGWVRSGKEAVPITHGTEGSMHRVPGGFALITQGFPFGTDLFVQHARQPTGPWTEPRKIASLPKLPDKSITYGAKSHPAFSADGKVLVSYNVNRSDAGPPGRLDEYRPGFLAISRDRLAYPARPSYERTP